MFFPIPSLAAESVIKVVVILQGALVYKEADFDAPVIANLKRGQIYDVSSKKKGYFYRVRVKPGMIGYVSDVDVRAASGKKLNNEKNENPKTAAKKESAEPEAPRKPFLNRRYRGLVVEMMSYTESTLGGTRSAQLPFFGIKWSGNDTVFSGEIYTDASIMAAFTAPKYYQDYTGNAASGWIVNMNFLFLNPQKQGRYHMTYFGFGPMFKYSHLNTSLTNPSTNKTNDYILDDMTLGAVFALGLGFDLGSYALRSDVRYYLEAKQYASFGLTFQMEF